MTKLERFLIKNSSDINESSQTFSIYYNIGNITIRISDHFTNDLEKCDLYIYNSVNNVNNKYYIVSFKGSNKFLNWTAQQIIDVIPFLQLQKEMLTYNIKSPDTTPKILSKKIDDISIKLPLTKVNQNGFNSIEKLIACRSKKAWTIEEIDLLPKLIEKNLKLTDIIINEDFKIFLNNTPCSYKQALNIYVIIVIDNKKEITIELANRVYELLNDI